MVCELLDMRCFIVNELIGSVGLSILLFGILYFIAASRTRLGFETTLTLSIPIILIFAIGVGQLNILMAFITVIVGIMLAWIFDRIIGNKG